MTMKGDTSLRADGMIGRLPDSSIVTNLSDEQMPVRHRRAVAVFARLV
jgi:hypothetical protein